MNRLEYLYGEIDIDDLSRIVNDHLKVAIDEIEEDFLRKEGRSPGYNTNGYGCCICR